MCPDPAAPVSPASPPRPLAMLPVKVGDRVEVAEDEDIWCPGIVVGVADDREVYDVEVNNEIKKYSRGEIRKPRETKSMRSLRRGSIVSSAHLATTIRNTNVEMLISSLILGVKKVYAFRGMPVQFLFLIFFTISAGYTYMDSSDRVLYHLVTSVRENLVYTETFNKVASPDDFYEWFDTVATNFWVSSEDINSWVNSGGDPSNLVRITRSVGSKRTTMGKGFFAEGQNVPLHWMLIRQHRQLPETCGEEDQASPINDALWDYIKQKCYGKYSSSGDGSSYRNNATLAADMAQVTTDPFVADVFKTGLPILRYSEGEIRSYKDQDNQFTLVLPYDNLNLDQVRSIMKDLKDNGWIDIASRMVSIETILYNAARGDYVLVRMQLEFSYSGFTTRHTNVDPFWLMIINNGDVMRLLFAIDLFATLYCIWTMRDIVWHACFNARIGHFAMGFWEVISFVHTIMLVVYLVYRYLVWAQSTQIGENLSATDLYNELTLYQESFAFARTFFVCVLWIGWLRLMEILRYSGRLNAVTETIRLAAADLLSLCFIASFIILSFAFVGNALYGWQLWYFATISESVAYLLRTIVSGDMSDYPRMEEAEPVWTPIYLFILFILAWLILINVVLGILAAGFNAASQSTRDRSWSWSGIKADCYNLPAIFGFENDDDDAPAPADTPSSASTKSEAAPNTNNNKGCNSMFRRYYKKREQTIIILTNYIEDRRAEIEQADVDSKHDRLSIGFEEALELDGWCLTRQQTIDLFQDAQYLVAESFASAEESRRAEKDHIIQALDNMTNQIRFNMVQVKSQIDVLTTQLNDVRNKNEHANKETEENLKQVQEAIGMVDQKSAANTNKVLGTVTSHRRYFDDLAASIFDSESRVRGDIQNSRYTGNQTAGSSEAESWQRDMQEREAALREQQRAFNEQQFKNRTESHATPAWTPSKSSVPTAPLSPRSSVQLMPTGHGEMSEAGDSDDAGLPY
eukprot:TRINITY_DN3211_c0_g1_i1.p1 TRINITY_DN3211_c0_g1~~TRINITY_DN3211_c0_g1_i1.p1  ORF type:complete len:987 (+),score=187.42 TRINITY_DN3211_c0_g1_i1:41-2962(+)